MATSTQHFLTATIYDKRGMVLSVGQNSYTKTHPLQSYFANKVNKPYKCVLHAEIDSIIRLKRKMHLAHKIHIERITPAGNPALAKPCPICALAIKTMLPNLKVIEHT